MFPKNSELKNTVYIIIVLKTSVQLFVTNYSYFYVENVEYFFVI
jgi:hypothetical protein